MRVVGFIRTEHATAETRRETRPAQCMTGRLASDSESAVEGRPRTVCRSEVSGAALFPWLALLKSCMCCGCHTYPQKLRYMWAGPTGSRDVVTGTLVGSPSFAMNTCA